MRMLIAGLFYFALVFVAAFALGTVRTFVLEPRFGEFIAVLCEAPFLLAVMIFAAPRAQRWAKLDSATGPLLGMGLFGLLLQQIAEFGLVLAAGETIASHIAYLSTPAGLVYVALLGVFVVLPAVLAALRPAA